MTLRLQSRNLLTVPEFLALELHVRIVWLRESILDMTQREFADVMDVSIRSVKGWEHPDLPRGGPSRERAARMSALVGGAYQPEAFMEVGVMDASLAWEINRKLDLIIRHFGIEDE